MLLAFDETPRESLIKFLNKIYNHGYTNFFFPIGQSFDLKRIEDKILIFHTFFDKSKNIFSVNYGLE